MKPQIATASKIIRAPIDEIYKILADYRDGHPHILPRNYFLSLDVEEGGFGEGTIVRFQMRLLGQTQTFRALITEPQPGRTLLETDIDSGVVTRFSISPANSQDLAEVTISTELKGLGLVAGLMAKTMLQKVYHEELDLLARHVESRNAVSRSISRDRSPAAQRNR